MSDDGVKKFILACFIKQSNDMNVPVADPKVSREPKILIMKVGYSILNVSAIEINCK